MAAEYFHGRFPFDFAPTASRGREGRLSAVLRVAGKLDGQDGMSRVKNWDQR